MNKTLLFHLIIFPTILFGQQTKKVIDKKTTETFYVLAADASIRHGEYYKYSYNKLIVRGFYKQGAKDSIWESYDFAGECTLKYDYTKRKILSYKPNDIIKDKRYKIKNSNNTSDTTLSIPPIFIGGDDLILSEIRKNIHYPVAAMESGKSGKVYVLFTVDKFGKPDNYHVENPLGYGMDEEAIRVLKLLPNNWLPGQISGQPVDVEVFYPISYKIQ